MAEKKKPQKKKKKAKSKRTTQAMDVLPAEDMAGCITSSLTDQIARIAADCTARAIFVYSDAAPGGLPLPQNLKTRVVYVSRSPVPETADGSDETIWFVSAMNQGTGIKIASQITVRNGGEIKIH